MRNFVVFLTKRQEGFAQDVADGMKPAHAYRNNYTVSGCNANTVSHQAAKMQRHPKVAARIKELKDVTAAVRALSRERKRALLEQFAEDAKAKKGDRISAIKVDNEMTGDNAPQQVQVFGLAELLTLVRSKPRE